ncbi:MAG: FIST N-terminal domain-containing protein [Phycisphaerales bacterium]|jgi:small ligand-binding sensory domain FIST|nr:FIST N-terminal domain-containing protein [Phycisphaerales bacterium]
MRGAAAISEHLDTRTASIEVASLLANAMSGKTDLVFVFASFHHRETLEEAVEDIRRALSPKIIIGVTTEAVVGCDLELEGDAGLSAIAMHMPGVTLTPWTTSPSKPVPISTPHEIPEWIGLREDSKAVFFFADPFSTPITRLLPALTNSRSPFLPIIGGMASGASTASYNRIILNDQSMKSGGVGLTISGPVQIDCLVSQGCRPIGKPLRVTKVDGNVVLELGGKPALDQLAELSKSASEHDRALLEGGLLLGGVIDEHKDHFGRGDFLVRSVMGLDRKRKGVAAGEFYRLGKTVQFHVRDAQTAVEDLQLLLDAQQLSDTPFAGLLVTCNGRGKSLFDEDDHDLTIIRERLGEVPIAGFFAAGEIGPVGGQSFLHGHTACLTTFRPEE